MQQTRSPENDQAGLPWPPPPTPTRPLPLSSRQPGHHWARTAAPAPPLQPPGASEQESCRVPAAVSLPPSSPVCTEDTLPSRLHLLFFLLSSSETVGFKTILCRAWHTAALDGRVTEGLSEWRVDGGPRWPARHSSDRLETCSFSPGLRRANRHRNGRPGRPQSPQRLHTITLNCSGFEDLEEINATEDSSEFL